MAWLEIVSKDTASLLGDKEVTGASWDHKIDHMTQKRLILRPYY